MDPLKIYDYLMKARERVLDTVRKLTPEQYQRTFAFGLCAGQPGGLGSTLTHIMVSEGYYIDRIEGRAIPPYDYWPIKYENPPPFEIIEKTWREQAKRIRAAVAAEKDWKRTITWLSFPDDTRGNKRFHITCTAGDIFTQLALHEVHHRAQIMAMLRESGAAILEDLDYNALMYDRREAIVGT